MVMDSLTWPIEGAWEIVRGSIPPVSGTVLAIPDGTAVPRFRASNFYQDTDSLSFYQRYFKRTKGHSGLDIICPKVPVLAMAKGTVKYATISNDWDTLSGTPDRFIHLQHEDSITIYHHLSEFYVKAGDKVEQGQAIAIAGNTGHSTGNHLHFGLIINGQTVDPWPHLDLSFLTMNWKDTPVDKELLELIWSLAFPYDSVPHALYENHSLEFVMKEIAESDRIKRDGRFLQLLHRNYIAK